jgi:hypothetical protein
MSKNKSHYTKLTHIKMNKKSELEDDQSVDVLAQNSEESTQSQAFTAQQTPSPDPETSEVSRSESTPSRSPFSNFTHKKFVESSPRSNSEQTTTTQSQNTSGRVQLPKFLDKIGNGKNELAIPQAQALTNRALALVDREKAGENKNFNPNSFSSIFNKDHQEISGIQRVFKKSIAFMLINLALFGMLTLISINLFSTSALLAVMVSALFIALTNLFFIIVADRSYVWLSLAGQIILLLLVHSFLGLGFDPITLFISLIIAILIFSAYSELEKVQLGSRLFSISHITGESSRILSTCVILVVCLGVFNNIVSKGAEQFFREHFLNNSFVLNNVVIGQNKELSLNRALIKGYRFYGEGNTKYTLRDFLSDNFRGGKPVISQSEEEDLNIECENKQGLDNNQCSLEIAKERDRRLEEWRKEAYPKIPYALDEVLDEAKFKEVTKQFYSYLIANFSAKGESNTFIIIPRSYIIPGVFAILLYILLTVFKPLYNWFVFILTWIIWSILKALGFVKIEVEAVEAEIVSI